MTSRTPRGFSLVETIIYISILALVVVLFVNLLISISGSYVQIRMARKLDSAAVSSMDRMTKEMRNASSVSGGSVLGISPGKLILNSVDSLGNPLSVSFDIRSSQPHIYLNGEDAGPLVPAGVTASRLIFRRLDSPVSQAVKIEMTLESRDGNSLRAANYYSTVILRGSY